MGPGPLSPVSIPTPRSPADRITTLLWPLHRSYRTETGIVPGSAGATRRVVQRCPGEAVARATVAPPVQRCRTCPCFDCLPPANIWQRCGGLCASGLSILARGSAPAGFLPSSPGSIRFRRLLLTPPRFLHDYPHSLAAINHPFPLITASKWKGELNQSQIQGVVTTAFGQEQSFIVATGWTRVRLVWL